MIAKIMSHLLLLLVGFLALSTTLAIETDPQKCLDAGFNPVSLQCETCESLLRVVGDQAYYEECLECCTIQSASEDLYEKASIQVDKRFVQSFPNLPGIIKSITNSKGDAERAIKVEYKSGYRPTLSLYRTKDSLAPAESLSISSWNIDDFNSYITDHIKAAK
jgi:hypothetical protein